MNDTAPLDPTPETTPPSAPRRRFPTRALLIGAAAGVVVLGVGAGGFALADALDSDDDRIVITSSDDPAPLTGDPTPGASPTLCVDDDGQPVGDDEYVQVTAAALDAVGGGTVTKVSRDDDPGKAWEVEVRLANGDEAEVDLNADLEVTRIELDRDEVVVIGSGSDDEVVVVEVRSGDC